MQMPQARAGTTTLIISIRLRPRSHKREGAVSNLFGKVVKLVVNTVALPVEVVKDVVTLAGVSTGEPKSYTAQRIEKLVEDAQD